MSTTEIIINEVTIETSKAEGFNVRITKQINDLRKLKTRNASFTSQITFPNTPHNTAALVTNVPTFKSSKVTPEGLTCQVLMNGVTVLAGGRFSLSAKNEAEYKGIIFFGNFDFFNLITGDISELQWAVYDQAWQPSNVDSIKATTTGIVFALASWFRPYGVQSLASGSVWNTKHDINFSGFHAYTRTIITNIIQELGFTYDDSAITATLWDEMALPCAVTKFAIGLEIASPIEADWSKTSTQTETISQGTGLKRVTFDTQIVDPDALFNNGTDQYTIDRTANITVKLNLKGTVTGTQPQWSGSAYFRIYKGSTYITNFLVWIGPLQSSSFDFSIEVTTPVVNTSSIYANVLIKDITVDMDTGNLSFLDAGAVADPTDTLTISDWIPKISKRDFLRQIFNIMNVQIETDSLANTVTLKQFDEVLTSQEQDWSKNLVNDRKISEGITLPYAQINLFKYADDEQLVRNDTEGTYTIINTLLRQQLDLITVGFGASDGAQRHGIYVRGTAVAEYPTYIMHSTRLAGMNTTGASATFSIDAEGAEFTAGDYIEVEGEFRQINARTSDTAGTVSTAFSNSVTSKAWTLRRFELQELTPPRLARIVATEGDYDVVQGTEDVTTSISGGKEATFDDALLWSNIIANDYQNLLDAVANPLVLLAWFRFEVAEFAAIDMLKTVYLDKYNSTFYINKINQYRADGFCKVELIRIN